MYITENPVADAERWAAGTGQRFRPCKCCGEPLYIADDSYYGSDAWYIGGEWYCDDCAESNFKMEVT